MARDIFVVGSNLIGTDVRDCGLPPYYIGVSISRTGTISLSLRHDELYEADRDTFDQAVADVTAVCEQDPDMSCQLVVLVQYAFPGDSSKGNGMVGGKLYTHYTIAHIAGDEGLLANNRFRVTDLIDRLSVDALDHNGITATV